MKIGILGCGATGSVFASYLRMGGADDIWLIDLNKAHMDAVRDHGMTKPICANIDLYTGFIYKMLGVPETLFTPLFAVARMAGWSAHRMEELFCAHRIIRPAYRPVIEPLEYKPLADR